MAASPDFIAAGPTATASPAPDFIAHPSAHAAAPGFIAHPVATAAKVKATASPVAYTDPNWNQPIRRDASGTPIYSLVGTHLTPMDLSRLAGAFEKKYFRTPTEAEMNALVSNEATLDEQSAAKVLAQYGRAADLGVKLGDAFTAAPLNAAMRSLGSGVNPGRSYMSMLTDNNLTFSQKLDQIGSEYGYNAPPDIKYWASQPGVIDNIMRAKPTSAEGVALQIMLGMHADLAKLKPQHPTLTGIETAIAEQFNPAYYVAGPAVGLLGKAARAVVPSIMEASRFGAAGAGMASVGERIANAAAGARRAASTGLFGERFFAMQEVYGAPGASEHDLLVSDMGRSAASSMADATNANTLGGLLIPDKQRVVHAIENPGAFAVDPSGATPLEGGTATGALPGTGAEEPPPGGPTDGSGQLFGPGEGPQPRVGTKAAQRGVLNLGGIPSLGQLVEKGNTEFDRSFWDRQARKVGQPTISDRAANTRTLLRREEETLAQLDPEAAAHLLDGDTYYPRSVNPVNPTFLVDVPKSENPWAKATQRFTGDAGGTKPIGPHMRTHATLHQAEDAGLELNPNWDPAGTLAVHLSKIRRYNTFLSRILNWSNLKDAKGEPALVDIDYVFDPRLPAQKPGGVNEAGALVPLEMGGVDGSGRLRFGSGRVGYDAASAFVDEYATRAAADAAARHPQVATWSADDQAPWIAKKAADYRENAWANMKREHLKARPNHNFDTAAQLSVPRLKGQALREEALNAAIDAHPTLGKVTAGPLGRDFASSHVDPDPHVNLGEIALDNVNSLVRQGLLSNLGFHPFFNILPLAVKSGVPKTLLARALLGGHIPQEWIDAAARDGASAPNFGGAYTMDPNLRARILSTAYGPSTGGLSNADMILRSSMYGSKLNQDITFGYFEDRVAAAWHNDNTTRLKMTPAESARAIRKELGDYNNLTAEERGRRLNQWFFFYSWMKTRLKSAATDWLTNPQKIMAPIAGVATANQMQGAPNIHDDAAANPLALSLGKDAQGNWRFLSAGTLFPQARYGEELLNMTAGALTGGGLNTAGGQAERLLTAHATPIAGMSVDALTTLMGRPDVPEGWNQTLWDTQEPIGEQVKEALIKSTLRYSPFQIQSTVEAVKSHDPAALIGAVGPAVYSLPDASRAKAASTAAIKLRAYLSKATDPNTRREIFDLLGRIKDGDPTAVNQANSMLWLSKKGLGGISGLGSMGHM